MRECTVEKLFDAHANGHHLAVDRYYVPLPDWGFSLVPGSLTLAIRDVKHLFNREEEGRHWLTFRPLTAADMDFVIFDCAPSFTLTTMSALCTARYVIAPVMAREELSLIGILACTRLLAKLRTYIELENPKHQHPIAEIASIVVNGRDSRHVNDIVATRAAIRADKVLGEYSVSDGHLPRCSTLKSHSSFGRPVDDDAFWTQCKIIASDLLILP
jgi:cellulose biosynthesis protein BcsQ